MHRSVLVPLDGSLAADGAVKVVEAIRHLLEVCQITLFMTVEPTSSPIFSGGYGAADGRIAAQTQAESAVKDYLSRVAEGLQGKADADKDGFVKTTELSNYVDDEVPRIAEKQFKRAQYPTVSPSGQAFPVARVK